MTHPLMADDPASPNYPVGTIAKLFMVSERRVQQLVKLGIVPKNEHGRYELVPAVQGYVRYLQERAQGRPGAPEDYHQEKSRLVKLQADKAQLEVEELADQLVRADDVRKEWEEMLGDMKGRLLGLPSKAAPIVAPQSHPGDVLDVLEDLVNEALQELYEYGDETVQREEALGEEREDFEAATEVDGEPVG
jgi:phage terminase Nu1 subunit (DNA packaging protein)